MKVLLTSKPQAMMSLAFSNASLWTSSACKSFHRNFSSSVSWITKGTSNASCKYLKIIVHGYSHSLNYNKQLHIATLWKGMGLGDQDAWTLKMVLYQCTGRKVASARTHPKSDPILCVKRKHLCAEMDEQVCRCTFQFGLPDHCLFSDFQIDLHNVNPPFS